MSCRHGCLQCKSCCVTTALALSACSRRHSCYRMLSSCTHRPCTVSKTLPCSSFLLPSDNLPNIIYGACRTQAQDVWKVPGHPNCFLGFRESENALVFGWNKFFLHSISRPKTYSLLGQLEKSFWIGIYIVWHTSYECLHRRKLMVVIGDPYINPIQNPNL